MSRRQRIALVVGVALLAATVFCPPWNYRGSKVAIRPGWFGLLPRPTFPLGLKAPPVPIVPWDLRAPPHDIYPSDLFHEPRYARVAHGFISCLILVGWIVLFLPDPLRAKPGKRSAEGGEGPKCDTEWIWWLMVALAATAVVIPAAWYLSLMIRSLRGP